jgi:hypothetical protein
MKGKELLDKIADVVLAYRPVRKKKKRKRAVKRSAAKTKRR